MVTGEDLIQLAGKLCVQSGAGEYGFRAAVSRAYYGAFHIARAFIEELGFSIPRNANVHGYLRFQLETCGHMDVGAAGTILGTLQHNRILADNNLQNRQFESVEFARLIVEMAHDFTIKLKEGRQEPARSEIRTGIADYQARMDA